MNKEFFTIVIALLGLIYLVIGAFAARGQQGASGFFLAKRRLNGGVLALSIMATQVGGGVVLGTAEEAYRAGVIALLWPLALAAGVLVVGLGIGKKLRALEVATVAELYQKIYNSRLLRLMASALSIVSLLVLLVAQLVASRTLFESFGMGSGALFVGLWLVVIAYTAVGGLRAVVYTDVLQTICIVIGLLIMTAVVWWELPTGVPPPLRAPSGGFSTLFLMPCLFMVIGQDMGQRCFSGVDGPQVRRAFLWSAAGLFVVGALPVLLGLLARQAGLVVAEGSSPLIMLVREVGGPTVAAVAAIAILLALLSTVDSLLCAIGSNLAQDFSKKPSLRLCQFLTLLVGLSGLGMAFFASGILSLQAKAYELSVCCLAPTVLAALYRPAARPLLSVMLGAVGVLAGFPLVGLGLATVAAIVPKRGTVLSTE